MPSDLSLKFPPVFYARYQVDRLSPEQVDEMLANGWFRNDLSVYSAYARFMGEDWRACLMLRLPLAGFTWKKRLAKLIRRNGRLFEVKIRPFQASDEKDDLWMNFKQQVHQWDFVPPLKMHLFRHAAPQDFNSWEVCVYDRGRLIALSVFDRGQTSLASLEAAYDPACKQFSLGLYTMLLEIDFGMKEGFSYYYPGFLPKDVSMFDYKLRPGGLEFFRLVENQWLPWEAVEQTDWLYDELVNRLNHLKKLLKEKQIFSTIGYGFHHWCPASEITAARYNVFLVVKSSAQTKDWNYLIAWDAAEKQFFLFSAQPQTGIMMPKTPGKRPIVRLFDISNPHFLISSNEMETIATVMSKLVREQLDF